ncbi:MAG: hypoxanthine phosphoribosyltransferase [Bacteroidetes bacterium]|nr:hypoxanthine phosphoribosyltransferase [Bacteroidota bacterium]
MKTRVADLDFELSITYSVIERRVQEIATEINVQYAGKTPLLVGILNGSFIFMADLVKELTIACETAFVKLASYHGGTTSTRTVRTDLDLKSDVRGRHVILVEDIIDTGHTMRYLVNKLKDNSPASIAICTLLLKPDALEANIPEIKYTGFEIPNEFVVGYGLDYQELGRNLKGIFKRVD